MHRANTAVRTGSTGRGCVREPAVAGTSIGSKWGQAVSQPVTCLRCIAAAALVLYANVCTVLV